MPLLVSVLVLIVDFVTKRLVLGSEYLTGGGQHAIIPGFFHIVYVENTGAAWGMFSGRMRLLALLSIAVLALIVWRYRKFMEGWWERGLALSLIMGGIIGNLIDRVCYRGVIDFLSFTFGSFEWPAFNVADSCICIGVGVYLVSSFLRPERSDEPTTSGQETPCQDAD